MKKLFLYVSLLTGAIFLAACSSDSEPIIEEDNNNVVLSRGIELSENEQNIVNVQNNFAVKLFDLAYNGENMVISPLSTACNVSLVANAATGETRGELLNALGYNEIGPLNALNSRLLTELYDLDGENVKFSLCNSIWLNEKSLCSLTNEFEKTAKDFYHADIFTVSFANNFADKVNNWATQKTDGVISDVYNQGYATIHASALLNNALYFKGAFKKKFDKSKTARENFSCLDNSKKLVDMMHGDFYVNYMQTEKAQAVSLPFGNGLFNLVIAMPEDGYTLTEAAIEAMNINKCYSSSTYIALPKFTEEYEFDLKNVYKGLGIDKDNALLENIIYDSSVERSSELSNFETQQKVLFAVDEDGAEAKATTNTKIDGYISAGHKYFTANRPFVYMVREKESGTVLFMGAYVK